MAALVRLAALLSDCLKRSWGQMTTLQGRGYYTNVCVTEREREREDRCPSYLMSTVSFQAKINKLSRVLGSEKACHWVVTILPKSHIPFIGPMWTLFYLDCLNIYTH